MKYIGNKTRLLSFIEESMKKEKIPFKGTFFDIFGGTGSVGKYFKQKGFKIISNDIMTYSYIFQYVNVKMNKLPSFSKINKKGIDGVINYLNNISETNNGYFFNNYAPSGKYKRKYFSNSNAKKIDAIRDKIETWHKKNCISIDEYYVLLSSLIDASDFVANISGTYGAYLKIWRSMALKTLELKVPTLYNNNKNNQVFQEDSNALIKNVKSNVLYIDPPYNERQYASNFHVLESLAVWDKQILTGKTGQRNYKNKKSLYCSKKDALYVFSDLISNADTDYIVVSYNNEGIIDRNDILTVLQKFGKVHEYKKTYRRFRTERDNDHRKYKKCDDKVIEHLYIAKNKKRR